MEPSPGRHETSRVDGDLAGKGRPIAPTPVAVRVLGAGAGILVALGGTTLVVCAGAPRGAMASGKDPVDYTFGRPVQAGEHTYDWYRKTHADEAAKRFGMDPKAVGDGMDTWHWWTGVDNSGFWAKLASLTGNPHQDLLGVKVDFLRMLTSVPRSKRFEVLGTLNDPDTVAADGPDQYGLTIDRMKAGSLTWDPEVFGYSSGVIGLQLYKNKAFEPTKWSLKKYLADASSVQPPYRVGMSCALCHIGFNPDHPPKNSSEPAWDNLASNPGNQYFREGMLFGYNLPRTSFIWQYLAHQEPGTSETSRFPSDYINNPVEIYPLYRVLPRLKEASVERITPAQRDMLHAMYRQVGLPDNFAGGALGGTAARPTIKTPHVLADGADSLGLLIASCRVYVNEGSDFQGWIQTWPLDPWDPVASIRRKFATREFDIVGKYSRDPNSFWMQTAKRMPNMATFLMSYDSYPLADAVESVQSGPATKNGKDYLTTDPSVLRRGKIAFADSCAACHSGKAPNPLPTDAAARRNAWREFVLRDDFLKDNVLSDDRRYPVSELGTNAARGLLTNSMAGSTFGQMSSLTFKQLKAGKMQLHDYDPSGRPVNLYNPLTGKYDNTFTGNAAYYRTSTLVSIWSHGPLLHNRSVGAVTLDPSVAGQVACYQDGMSKLLWPERRLGVRSIKVTTEESTLPDVFALMKRQLPEFANLPALDVSLLTVPKGTSINLIMNVHPRNVKSVLQAYVNGVLQGQPRSQFARLQRTNMDKGRRAMLARLLAVSTCPDFIEDKGHYYGRHLSDGDKQALIAYMKTF
ncbi:MAG: hypothetical protein JWM80_4131 [Cyanobacteria bacterium RYN_339]|nr:hypothetical protein [Cyanobacteria bacterium RYN_339]